MPTQHPGEKSPKIQSASLQLAIAKNIQKYFFIITKHAIYVTKCVKSSIWTKFDCSSLENGFRNDHNAKINNWVIMRIFNELWCWFSKATKVMPQWTCIKNMRSINKTFFFIYRINGAFLMNIARNRVKLSAKLKFECSGLKNDLRNDQNAKISNPVNMRIFNELRCWFSKASKVLLQWICIRNMKSIKVIYFYLSRKGFPLNERS